jgi:hypothetical protein
LRARSLVGDSSQAPGRHGQPPRSAGRESETQDRQTAGLALGDHTSMRKAILLTLIVALGVAACGSSILAASASAALDTPAHSPVAVALAPAQSASAAASQLTATTPPSLANADAAGTVWLCRPGLADNPCTGDLSTTIIDAAGKETVLPTEPAKDPPIDCFYVYPTVSQQMRPNADLSIDPEEQSVAPQARCSDAPRDCRCSPTASGPSRSCA